MQLIINLMQAGIVIYLLVNILTALMKMTNTFLASRQQNGDCFNIQSMTCNQVTYLLLKFL
jgi:hypothetical protein